MRKLVPKSVLHLSYICQNYNILYRLIWKIIHYNNKIKRDTIITKILPLWLIRTIRTINYNQPNSIPQKMSLVILVHNIVNSNSFQKMSLHWRHLQIKTFPLYHSNVMALKIYLKMSVRIKIFIWLK